MDTFDTISPSMATINGTNGNDSNLLGTNGDDIINGLAGDDVLLGRLGNDILNGGTGNDHMEGGFGDDRLDGGAGADRMEGGAGYDLYIVDNVNDVIVETVDAVFEFDGVQSSVTWTLGANLENLTLTGNANINGTGNAGKNIITGNAGNNILNGGDGDDYFEGGGGSDILNGGAGNDIYRINPTLTETINEDLNAGIDIVLVSLNEPGSYTLGTNLEQLVLVTGTTGSGNNLNNTITGNGGNNYLYGRGGNDYLYGRGGNDILVGGGGNDILVGGGGNDTLKGGRGADRFSFTKLSVEGVDIIVDFSVAQDTIGIYNGAYFQRAGLTTNEAITADQFRIGASAGDAGDRFIYNSTSGALFFDRDGIGRAAQVQFATLSTGLAMTNADIFVFA
ncbi:calcium-binding protein [Trichocoleus sp. FACHB-90]|uniref:calcium-binding protein n=1 Tax=Cyanophyceae TaxID=3028117 RepID=UPI0019BFED71|nr:calcium-binding protein [Trichocoleus sp. FACHB-90]MBD1930005.1 calcium-binding protein [Trichocoleus sp. FACHB-90]